MDLSTKYLGMNLRTPVVPSASPLSASVENIKRMEDAGAAAVVLHSLFEEQLSPESSEMRYRLVSGTIPSEPSRFRLDPEAYLDHILRAKEAVSIPIIASLNGKSLGGWVDYARRIEQAGADALELNLFYIPTDIDMTSECVEQNYLDIVEAVRSAVTLPVAVKLGPYFSNVAHIARRLDAAGADALVLFNRFYQPDIDLMTRELQPHILLSTPQAMRLPLHWIAMLHKRVRLDLAASGGVRKGEDALKLLMAGASVTMVCSVLLRHGIDHIRVIEQEMLDWMDEYEYESVRELHGSLSQRDCLDPAAFERDQYIRALQSYKLPMSR